MIQRFQRWILGLVTVVTYLAAADTQADAQVRFGIRIGGVRVGVGRPIYGPGYGRGYYGPGYGIGYGTRYGYGYRPAPVYVPQPIYVQPQPVYVPSQPQYAAPIAIPAGATPVADGDEIVLFSPSTNTSNIRYLLNGQAFTMPPGTKQRFTNDRTWTIQFESTPGQMVTYTLTSNRYKFKSGGTGVGLFQTQDLPEVVQPGLPPAPLPNPPE